MIWWYWLINLWLLIAGLESRILEQVDPRNALGDVLEATDDFLSNPLH